MVHKCAVPYCKGNCSSNPKVGLFSFPKDEVLKMRWIIAIRRKDFIPTKHSRVCELHFKKSDIETEASAYDSKTGKTITAPLGVKRLRKGTIPSLNIPKYAEVSSREDPDNKRIRIEEEQLSLALEQSLKNGTGETSQSEDSAVTLSLSVSRKIENKNDENQQKKGKRKRKCEKGEISSKKLNDTFDSNSMELCQSTNTSSRSLDTIQEIAQNHNFTENKNDLLNSNLSQKKDANVEQKKNLSNSSLSSSLSVDTRVVENGFQVKEEKPWEEEYGFPKQIINESDMVKIVNVESSSKEILQSTSAMETKESCDTSFYKKPLKIDNRDETFGKLVACEMSDLRGNPDLYLKTQQSILKLLVEAHFELMSSV